MEERGKQRMTRQHYSTCAQEERLLSCARSINRAQYFWGLPSANLVNILDPECVVLGGGVSERLGEEFVGPSARRHMRTFLRRHGRSAGENPARHTGDNAARWVRWFWHESD